MSATLHCLASHSGKSPQLQRQFKAVVPRSTWVLSVLVMMPERNWIHSFFTDTVVEKAHTVCKKVKGEDTDRWCCVNDVQFDPYECV